MKRIVLIEDNPDNRLLVRAILDDLFDIEEYETGTEALAQLAAPADLVLLDVSLPEMDGIEVLKRLRQRPGWEAVPIIALTAHAMAGDRDKFLHTGFDDYVAKPIIDEALLLAAIQRALDRQT